MLFLIRFCKSMIASKKSKNSQILTSPFLACLIILASGRAVASELCEKFVPVKRGLDMPSDNVSFLLSRHGMQEVCKEVNPESFEYDCEHHRMFLSGQFTPRETLENQRFSRDNDPVIAGQG